jgi:hypothetical protein
MSRTVITMLIYQPHKPIDHCWVHCTAVMIHNLHMKTANLGLQSQSIPKQHFQHFPRCHSLWVIEGYPTSHNLFAGRTQCQLGNKLSINNYLHVLV